MGRPLLLIVDLETSGLLNPTLPADHESQPWPVQIAAKLVRVDRTVHSFMNVRIRADGRLISKGATEVHGITSAAADRSGWAERVATIALLQMAGDAQAVIGFGVKFDTFIVEGSVLRAGGNPRKWMRPGLRKIDLIVPAANAAQLPSDHESNTYRWPKLTTAAGVLLGENPNMAGAHDAWTDMERAERIFYYLCDKGMIELGPENDDSRDGVSPVERAEATAPA